MKVFVDMVQFYDFNMIWVGLILSVDNLSKQI